MTTGKKFKKKVRALAKETGKGYAEARREGEQAQASSAPDKVPAVSPIVVPDKEGDLK